MENNEVLKELLKEYEQKRTIALNDLENKKNDLYSKHPELR